MEGTRAKQASTANLNGFPFVIPESEEKRLRIGILFALQSLLCAALIAVLAFFIRDQYESVKSELATLRSATVDTKVRLATLEAEVSHTNHQGAMQDKRLESLSDRMDVVIRTLEHEPRSGRRDK